MKVWEDENAVQSMIALYDSGLTIKQVASRFGLSAGKLYYIMHERGCVFRSQSSYNHTMSEEHRRKLVAINTGKRVNEETRRKISESRRSKYNGLNGYGHEKKQNNGYILVYAPMHPKAHVDGYVLAHTVIAERAMGRYLLPNEEVHHINHRRDDNRLENLLVMDKHEHHSMHMKERFAQRREEKMKGVLTYQ